MDGSVEVATWGQPAGVLVQAAQMAQTDDPVLIVGEQGTGHEQVARHIHSRSRRSTSPFLYASFGLPEPMLVAELLGDERRRCWGEGPSIRKGVIELAEGGVLFIPLPGITPRVDEIMCRLLREGTYQHLGRIPRRSDVRVIAWAVEDLNAVMLRSEISRALYQELHKHGCEIKLPSLRDRMDEIPDLAERYLELVCPAYGLAPMALSPSARTALQTHSWPGNLREFHNVLGRAALIHEGPTIEADDLSVPRKRRR